MKKAVVFALIVFWMATVNVASADMTWVNINDPGVSGHEGFTGQMSKYETTNAQFCEFLTAAKSAGVITVSGNDVIGASGPYSGKLYYNLAGTGFTNDGAINGGAARINYSGDSFSVGLGFENHPVTYVSWYGATAFCDYYGYRLPTEEEWQAVADYDGSYTYGCGTSINNTMANYFGSNHPDGTTSVGAFGEYGYGMCDMAGNANEWTSSIYSGDYHVMRGGAWNDYEDRCAVSFEHSAPLPNAYIGFRVVNAPEPATLLLLALGGFALRRRK
jgi:formylglycine-generating enzyme required for sulfatase activity